MCRTRFLLSFGLLYFLLLPCDSTTFGSLRESPGAFRGSGRPARFRGLLTPRPRASANFSYFWVVMCLPTAMRAQLLAFRVALAMPPAPRVKVYGLFGIRSVHPRPCTHDPTPQPAASRPAWFCEISEHRSTAIKRKPCIKYRPPPVQVLVYTGTLFTGVNFIK